jgi:DNA-binding HxlR family transcriptional regulator
VKAKNTKCPAELSLAMIGGRWKIPIIFHLLAGKKRFSELARLLTGVTQKVLTQQLREMERNHLVEREIFAQVPPRVEYSLTELGRSLAPVVEAMCRWGEQHGDNESPGEGQR